MSNLSLENLMGFVGLDMTTDGDVVVASNGDLKLTNTAGCVMNQTIMALCTNKGDYKPDVAFGADLGSLIGRTNLEFEQLAPDLVYDELNRLALNIYDPSVVALAAGNNAMVMVELHDVGWIYNVHQKVQVAVAFPDLSGDVTVVYSSIA